MARETKQRWNDVAIANAAFDARGPAAYRDAPADPPPAAPADAAAAPVHGPGAAAGPCRRPGLGLVDDTRPGSFSYAHDDRVMKYLRLFLFAVPQVLASYAAALPGAIGHWLGSWCSVV